MDYSKITTIEKIGVQNFDNLPLLLQETLSIYCDVSWDLYKCRIYCVRLSTEKDVKVIESGSFIITLHKRSFSYWLHVDFNIVYPGDSLLAYYSCV